MTLTTDAVREFGVRHRWPGDTDDRITPCADIDAAETELADLALRGLTRMEIVTRTVSEWAVAPEGLAANVRALAEAYVDEQVDDGQVDAALNDWLSGDDRHPLEIAGAFQRTCAAVKWLRAAEDGPVSRHVDRDALVREREELLAATVRRVIGGAS